MCSELLVNLLMSNHSTICSASIFTSPQDPKGEKGGGVLLKFMAMARCTRTLSIYVGRFEARRRLWHRLSTALCSDGVM
ncbi:unnamed protein product [Chondrus crispus]|uniref:Uncharacterized protein n=1 Tax=Chondrus crispus TaxID=2769 RepID=R7Q672_CHOCR|nr:unnamed protein product [Chondrus crispus]CDF33353.1 unnamed protein product [Chondrus crispus]|eukprot:XP_005713156.1 unnamed protein product [Chondrus crispus]